MSVRMNADTVAATIEAGKALPAGVIEVEGTVVLTTPAPILTTPSVNR